MPAVSGVDHIKINDPPKTTFTYTMDTNQLTDNGWSSSAVASAILARRIGYSVVVGLDSTEQKWLPYKYWNALPN